MYDLILSATWSDTTQPKKVFVVRSDVIKNWPQQKDSDKVVHY
jgi:hypothetical protein